MSSHKSNFIQATSRQTRFHIVDNANSKEIDLHTVNISAGKTEILSDAHLKLANGVHYVLVGRNGVGKSTLLRSIYEKTIPGLSKDLRILLLQQSQNDDRYDSDETVLQYVVRSDKDLTETLRKSSSKLFASLADFGMIGSENSVKRRVGEKTEQFCCRCQSR